MDPAQAQPQHRSGPADGGGRAAVGPAAPAPRASSATCGGDGGFPIEIRMVAQPTSLKTYLIGRRNPPPKKCEGTFDARAHNTMEEGND